MAELDELDRSLALAQIGLAAPPGVRERVRAKLGPVVPPPELTTSPAADPRLLKAGASGMAWRAVPTWAALALTGLGFAAGYLLGQRPAKWADEPARQIAALPTETARAETTARSEPASQSGATAHVGGTASAEAVSSAGSRTLPDAHEEAAERSTSDRLESEASEARSKAVHVKSRTPHRATTADGLAAELALLQRAERAIRAQNADLAVALLDQLDREHPKAQLGQEREAARLLAECERSAAGASAPSEATERARQYLARHSASVYSERIRNLCGLDVTASRAPATVSSGDVQTTAPNVAEESPSSGH